MIEITTSNIIWKAGVSMPLNRLRKTALLLFVFYSLSLSTALAIGVAPTDKVPPVVKDDVKFCLEKTEAFFEEISSSLGTGLFWPNVQLYIAADDEEYIRLLKAKVKSSEIIEDVRDAAGFSYEKIIFINLAKTNNDKEVLVHIVAHEVTHQIQSRVTGNYNGYSKIYWLSEGMAEVAAAQVAERLELAEMRQYRSSWISELRSAKSRPQLSRLESENNWRESSKRYGDLITYQVASLAALRLVDLKGWPSLMKYFDYLRNNNDYSKTNSAEEAFLKAFGMSVADFERDFETYAVNQLQIKAGK